MFSSLHFCAMILIKEFSLASRFYLSQLKFALQNLRNALQIAKCEALIGTLYFYGLQKDDKKDKLDCIILCIGIRTEVLKIAVSCSPKLIVILCSHLWKVLCPQSVLFLEKVK